MTEPSLPVSHGELLTAPTNQTFGHLVQDFVREHLAVFSDGHVFVTANYIESTSRLPEIDSTLQLIKRFHPVPLKAPEVIDPGVLKSFYSNANDSGDEVDDDKRQQDLRKDIYRLMEQAMGEGSSDLIIRARGKNGNAFIVADGVMSRLVNGDWDYDYAWSIQRAAYSWAGKSGSAERGWSDNEHQGGQIKEGLPPTIRSSRLQTLKEYEGKETVFRLMPFHEEGVTLQGLQFSETEIESFSALASMAAGVAIVTGPTGSGKTHTLHGILDLSLQMYPGDRWITVEDPVEIPIDHDMVTQIDATCSSGADTDAMYNSHLDAAMRGIPRRLLFGEIRSSDSAAITFRAGRTGHAVLTSLHTDDGFGAVPRLVDMGVEPSLLISDIRGLTGQRLVRCLCKNCKIAITRNQWQGWCPDWLERIFKEMGKIHIPNPTPCGECRNGYAKGRRVLTEIICAPDEEMMQVMIAGKLSQARTMFRRKGGRTLADQAVAGVRSGEFCPREVMRSMNVLDLLEEAVADQGMA